MVLKGLLRIRRHIALFARYCLRRSHRHERILSRSTLDSLEQSFFRTLGSVLLAKLAPSLI